MKRGGSGTWESVHSLNGASRLTGQEMVTAREALLWKSLIRELHDGSA